MRKYIILTYAIAILIVAPNTVFGQCKGFAKKICKLELNPYIHDGNYHAAILVEGEEAELYKTFYSGQQYRIAVCSTTDIPNIEFRVVDNNKKVLYNNKDHNYIKTWDFVLSSSQQLKIIVKVPPRSNPSGDPIQGCVSIMFGLKGK